VASNKGNILIGGTRVSDDDVVALRDVVDALDLQRTAVLGGVGHQN
jgi:hypothetical protein